MLSSLLQKFTTLVLSLSTIHQSKTVRTIAVFASGNMVATLLGLVGSLVQMRYIGPEDMGILRTLLILPGYLMFLHIGVFDGLQREIPLQMGRGNQAKAEEAASACLAWIVLISSVCGTLFVVLALRAAFFGDWKYFWGWLAYVPFVISAFYGGYLSTTFRTGQQFVTLSRVNVIQAVIGTLVLPLLPVLGYFGACLRLAVGSVTNLFFLHRWRPLKARPRLDLVSFWEVIRIGLPLSAIGYVSTSLWTSLESTFLLEWFGKTTLGLFFTAFTVRTLAVQLSQNLNQVFNVKIYEQYGRTNRAEDCLRLIFKPMAFAFLASLPLIAVGWFLVPPTIKLLTPKYVESIFFMQIMLLMMPIAFLQLPITILWAMARRVDCFICVIVGFLTFVNCSCVFYVLNIGVLSVVIASMLGQVVYTLTAYALILRLVYLERRGLVVDEEVWCGTDVQV